MILLFVTSFCIASVVVDRPTSVRPLLWAYSLAAGATALIGLFAYATGGAAAQRTAALDNQNPGYYAALLLPALIFTLNEVLTGRAWILGAMVSVACAAAIVVSGSRATWVSVVVVVILFLLPRLGAVRRISAVAILVAMFLVVQQIPGVAALIENRSQNAVSTGGAGRTDILVRRPYHLRLFARHRSGTPELPGGVYPRAHPRD